MPEIGQILEGMRDNLNRLQEDISRTERMDAARGFMANLFEFGMGLNRDPSLRESSEVTRFLRESADRLSDAVSDLEVFIFATEKKFYDSWECDEWKWVCQRRSSLEFLRDLYCDTEFAVSLYRFNTGTLDDLLRERGQQEGYLSESEIPDGIPPSHWWWWYPEEPPSYGQ